MSRWYVLNPAMPVLLRPDDTVQLGWDPRRAVLIAPPPDLSVAALAALLRSMQTRISAVALHRRARADGLREPAALTELLTAVVAAGLARVETAPRPSSSRCPAIRVHGRGPLSDLLATSLRGCGARVEHSRQPHARLTGTDLVVLADTLVVDPRLLRELHGGRVAHLAVRVRDGVGLIGPLVIPGVTSCLDCADLHRGDRDPAWPALAAQLRETVGTADPATVLATGALALTEVNRVVAAVRGAAVDPAPPPTWNATVEFDVAAGTLLTRRWRRHPRCRCWSGAPPGAPSVRTPAGHGG
ncbi:cyclodehydratase [Mycolicibacillus parakoreensis]|uniref:Cyclodehydratase n=1 Tax=Mycolicibacillus parakoreensis TaxID=1069221 RepID=A0ABY3TZT4_9MYCO|nr:cyclodehydratase [Mycolicibacillus parakoreensis]MCV7315655.1 cyclodehydratase [Mycolicibacillus parakoreensis]ULN51906.1 cyclodehydratase [Mycolicibacillus parakoreensis]